VKFLVINQQKIVHELPDHKCSSARSAAGISWRRGGARARARVTAVCPCVYAVDIVGAIDALSLISSDVSIVSERKAL